MPTTRALLAGVLSAAALASSAQLAHAAEPDLLSRWALDVASTATPNAVDSRLDGTSGDATPIGTSIAGRFGQGLSLATSGAPRGLYAADSARLVEPASVTVLAWVKRATAPTFYAPIVAKGGVGRDDTGVPGECELSAFSLISGGDGGPHFEITTVDGTEGRPMISMTQPLPSADVWDGRWHAVAGIFDAASRTVSVALDGKIVSTAPADGTAIAYGAFPERGLSVGRYADASCVGPGTGYDGDVDEVRIYGRALSASELAHLQDPAASTPPTLPIGGTPAPAPTTPTPPTSAVPKPPAPDVSQAPAPSQPAPSSQPAPVTSQPAPKPFIVGGPAQLDLGGKAKSPTKPSSLPDPLRKALDDASKKAAASLGSIKAQSVVIKEVTKLSKKEAAKLEPSRRLEDVLDELLYGMPVTVKAPAGARYVQISAALTLRRKTNAGKVEQRTILLPGAVLPVKGGVATGRITIDRVAAAELRKSGAVDAAVSITSVVVAELPGSTPAEKASIDDKLAKQATLNQKLAKKIELIKKADDAATKATKQLGNAKTEGAERQAERKQEEAQEQLKEAEASAVQTQADLAKEMQKALDEMVRKIIDFLRQLNQAETDQMRAITRL